jgi:hypothetical protein
MSDSDPFFLIFLRPLNRLEIAFKLMGVRAGLSTV